MVWALSVTETVSYAALFYCFAVMLVPMREELDASTGQLSAALSLAIAVNGAAAIPVGRWLDRHGARWVMSGGSLLGAASVVAWSQARDLPQLYLAFVGIGLAGAAVLYEPAFAVINTWFRRDRHAALLTLTVVAGFSSTIFLPLSQALVDDLGWRGALLVLAGPLAACAVPQALLLRRCPADLGLAVDGDGAAGPDVPGIPVPAGHVAAGDVPAAWASAAVRRLTGAAVLETLAVTVVAVHLVAYLRDTGASPGTAAWGAGAIGVLSVAGRITLTGLATRVGLARLAATMVAAQAPGVAALLLLPRPAGLVVFVVLFGAGFGVMTIARAALLGRYVPPEVFGRVSGGQSLAANAGRVVAPTAAGALISLTGYAPALVAVAACSLGAAALLLAAERSWGQSPRLGAPATAAPAVAP
jgi:MFS family permease